GEVRQRVIALVEVAQAGGRRGAEGNARIRVRRGRQNSRRRLRFWSLRPRAEVWRAHERVASLPKRAAVRHSPGRGWRSVGSTRAGRLVKRTRFNTPGGGLRSSPMALACVTEGRRRNDSGENALARGVAVP